MRTLLKLLGGLVVIAVVVVAVLLTPAHVEIRGIDPEIPTPEVLLGSLEPGPRQITLLNTATQSSPGLVMAFPSFVLEWADGRIFLVDAGMDEAGARAFGEPLEMLAGADPIEPLGSTASGLGPAVDRIAGVALTHLHVDHTGGLVPLCEALGRPLPLYQTPWQADLENFTTRPGNAHIDEAACLTRVRLEGDGVFPIPGFPGLVAIPAAGHTPGSTVFAARVGAVTWIMSGDVNNALDALRRNEPKPLVYSLLIVPEAPARLERMRSWLGALDAEDEVTVLVSHDQLALEASGIAPWPRARREAALR